MPIYAFPASAIAVPPPPAGGFAIIAEARLTGPPFIIPPGGPWPVPAFSVGNPVPATGIMVVNFNLRFGTAGGPIIAPSLMYAAYLSINGGIPEEVGRYKVGASGPGASWEQGTLGGSVAFIVPPGNTSVDVYVEASPGGVIELKPAPILTTLSMMA